jgi:hypothetical protein
VWPSTGRLRESGAASGDIVDRASRGSGLSGRFATWIWSGELTAQGNQEQSLIDQPGWAIYFPSIEQPMLGRPGGTVISDWFVFVDINAKNVVAATSLPTTGAASSPTACPAQRAGSAAPQRLGYDRSPRTVFAPRSTR